LRTLWSVPHDALSPRRYDAAEIIPLLTSRIGALELTGLPGEAARAALDFLATYQIVPAKTVVLGHTDPNLSNYLWDGSVVRIIDFEDSGSSDPEFELADLVEHISSRATDWNGFIAGFDLDSDRFLRARCIYATHWLHLLRPGGPGEPPQPSRNS
jgi:Ser/Thr protein kinase RdoA (MazF antagonist)